MFAKTSFNVILEKCFIQRTLFLLVLLTGFCGWPPLDIQAQDELPPKTIDDSPIKTFRGLGELSAAAFAPNGTQVVTVGDIGAILWNIDKGNAEAAQWYKGHKDKINAVAFSPNGSQLLSGSNDMTLRLWNTQSGEKVAVYDKHSSYISAVAFLPDGSQAVSASLDNTAKLWDLKTNEVLFTYRGHLGNVNAVAVSKDGKKILTGSSDNTAKLWDVESAGRVKTLFGHTGAVRAVAFEPGGDRVLTGGGDKIAILWKAITDENSPIEREVAFVGHTGAVLAIAMSPDKKWVLTGSEDKTAKIWDAEKGEEFRALIGHRNRVHTVAFSKDGMQIMTASSDGRILTWDISDLYPKEDEEPTAPIPQVGGGSLGAGPGETVKVPIVIYDLEMAKAFGFQVEYDAKSLAFENEVSIDNTVISSWGLADAFEDSPGHLQVVAVALAGDDAAGSGFLIFLTFRVLDEAKSGETLLLNFTNFSDDLSGVSSTPVKLSIGSKGDVDGNGQITSADVQMAFDLTLRRFTSTPYQTWAADANKDNRVTAVDVQIIFEAALGRIEIEDLPGKSAGRVLSAADKVGVTSVVGLPGKEILVPIRLEPASPITSFLIDLEYDRTKLTFLGASKEGTLTQSFGLADAVEVEPGLIRVSAAALGMAPASSPGDLIRLRFLASEDAIGKAGVVIVAVEDDLLNAETSGGAVDFDLVTSIDWMVYE
ncbi:MAG: cohesin domain-containing protein [Candidatus Omnitrophota bacterium]